MTRDARNNFQTNNGPAKLLLQKLLQKLVFGKSAEIFTNHDDFAKKIAFNCP